jgi:hypothetical protein
MLNVHRHRNGSDAVEKLADDLHLFPDFLLSGRAQMTVAGRNRRLHAALSKCRREATSISAGWEWVAAARWAAKSWGRPLKP